MKHRIYATLRFVALFAAAATTDAVAQVATDEGIKGFATCQAWAVAVYVSPDSFPDEWVAWAFALQATGVASPMSDEWSPLKNNPMFQQTLRETRDALAKEPVSSESPSYRQAYQTCMAHAEALKKQRKPQ
ncbi:hypothetical protein AACH06_29260 [Ideonella sp. DXS29W]|uniref:Uncharacterized protein n=1 Tax=Ideonella lacteola TaxID=2984193 RepID=A0ABU9BYS3_9BURK